jgi:hypothetical protein
MKLMKQMSAGAIVLAVALLVVAPNVAATRLYTGNAIADSSLQNEEVAVRDFEGAYDLFNDGLLNLLNITGEEGAADSFVRDRVSQVTETNGHLQETEFNTDISSEFTAAVPALKQSAQTLTDKVTEVAAGELASRADVAQAIDELQPLNEKFVIAVEALEDGAARYNNNAWLLYVLVPVGAVIIGIAAALIVLRIKRNTRK